MSRSPRAARRRHALLAFALLSLAAMCSVAPASAATPAALPDLLTFLRQRLPSTGIVEATFDHPNRPGIREFLSFDIGFGAFLVAANVPMANGAYVVGLSATGRSYRAPLTSGGPEIVSEYRYDDSAVQDFFPFVILYDLVRRKDLQDQATSVERADDGTWTIVFSLPQRLRRPPMMRDPSVLSLLERVDVAYRIDASARIVALRNGPPSSPWQNVEYPSDSTSPLTPVAQYSLDSNGRAKVIRRLAGWTYKPASDPAPFEPDAALARARTEVQPLPDADPAKNNPAWDGVKIDQWTKDRAAALAASPTVPRKPLPWLNIILGTFGVAVLATAAFLWLRRRGAAA
ncbi:MAG: hypothetical protein IBJ11_07860 [Phycisphaerales bacterium]|nr:hypothetical protein [Phycisphaerales bacterium]